MWSSLCLAMSSIERGGPSTSGLYGGGKNFEASLGPDADMAGCHYTRDRTLNPTKTRLITVHTAHREAIAALSLFYTYTQTCHELCKRRICPTIRFQLPTRLFLRVHPFAAELRVQHVHGSLFLLTRIPAEAPTLILEMIGYEERNV
jgi:hypothetical protein